jgi:hypothetical protein
MTTHRIRRSMSTALAAALALVALAGCEASMEEVMAAKRPAVEQVFERMKTLADPAFALPPLEADGVSIGDATVRLEGPDSNALFIPWRHLADPAATTNDGNGGTHSTAVAVCGEALRGEFHGAAAGLDAYLTECGRAEYVFVLRTVDERSAGVTGTDTFEPGLYQGEVLLFRLADGAALGGFRVATESSGEVSVLVDDDGNPIDAGARLDSDLTSKVFVAIEEGLKTHVPGAVAAD